MSKKISIGRDSINDLCIPQEYGTVSNRHADIEESDEGRLYLFDHSSNGTVVNGRKIKNMYLEIADGDDIKLANTYSLSWKEIRYFFPRQLNKTTPLTEVTPGRETELHHTPTGFVPEMPAPRVPERREYIQDVEIAQAKTKWNWGAFLLNWIWAIGHSCWWPFFVSLGIGFVACILLAVLPIAGFIISGFFHLAMLGISVYLGVKGNAIAWENGCFDNIDHFHRKEKQWMIAGFIVWGVYLLIIFGLILFSVLGFFSFLSLLSI